MGAELHRRQEVAPKKRKRQQGCRTPNRVFYSIKYTRGCRKSRMTLKNFAAYQRARMRYWSTEVPSLATGTLNWAANAAVLVYL